MAGFFYKPVIKKSGNCEDAILSREHFIHHPVLTSMLNAALLTPQEVIDKALEAAFK